jgi:hypothetical protein
MSYLRGKNINFYPEIKGYYKVTAGAGKNIRINRLFEFLKVNEQYSFEHPFFQKGLNVI